MVDLGRVKTNVELGRLRSLVIGACGTLADSAWPASFLDEMPSAKELDAKMLASQSTFRGTLNAVWAEKARLKAKDSVKEQLKRARGNLFGKFKHLGTVGDTLMKD